MLLVINEKEFELNTKLSVCYSIQQRFKKPYMEVFQTIDTMGIDEQIKILYSGLSKEVRGEMNEQDFINFMLDSDVGLDGLLDAIMTFINQIQYPGLTEEEIEKKLMEKQEKANRLRNL